MIRRSALFLALFVAVVCLVVSAFGQGTDLGTVRGTVTDTGGAVIADAAVVITDKLTKATRETRTNSQGNYELVGLNAGTYTVTITAPGMSKSEITNIVVNGSDSVGVDAALKISSAQESVVVSMQSAAIDTEDQTISQTIDNQAVIELPRDSRNVYSFLYLNPNITQADADGNFKFIGAQSYGASFSLDGQRSNGGIFGQPTNSQPSLEAVGEINILTSDFSAEYAGIANVRVTTKRGGASYHGSAFYNNKNSALAAWNLNDKIAQANFVPNAFQSQFPTPFFNITDVGGSVGGPVPLLKKTWFFAAFERDYTVQPVSVLDTRAVHPDLYTGNFSALNDSAKPLVPSSVTLTPAEIATDTITDSDGNQRFVTIPARLLNPTVQALINTYFPKVGLGVPIDPTKGRIAGGFQTNLPTSSVQDIGTLRLDHDFSENNHLYGVYNVSSQTSSTTPVEGISAEYVGLGVTKEDRRNNTVSLSYTHNFSPNVINEVRGGFNRQSLLRHSNTTLEGFLSSIGFTQSDISAYGSVVGAFALSTYGHPAINFSNTFTTFNNGGRNTFRPLNQNLATFGDTLTWIKGKHAFRMGGDVVRNAAVDGFALNRNNPRGSMTYAGSGTNPFTAFLLGLPPTSVSSVLQPRPPMDVSNWEHGYFVQDSWRVNSKLTVNLGLRYELIIPFVDSNDLIANFDPNYVNPTTGQLGRFVIPSAATLKYLDTRIIDFGYAFANQYSLGRGTIFADKLNFAPRVGLAYRLGSKSVIRGGYGIYYPTSAAQGIRDPIATNPFNQAITKHSVSGNPLDGWPGNGVDGISPISGGAVRTGLAGTPAVNVVPFDLKQPRIHQYNATFEHELGWGNAVRFSYLGATMHGLIAGKDLNLISPSDVPFGTHTVDNNGEPNGICDPVNNGDCAISNEDAARYRFPALGDFLLSYGNYGHAQSNAFQTTLEHRYSHGLLLSISYTYLDQKSTALDTGNSSLGGIAYNPITPDSDYGTDGYVSKHRVVAYGVYDLPVGRGRQYGSSMSRWGDFFVGGWQTSFNMFAKSGTAFTPFWICDDCNSNPIEPGNIGISSVDAVGDFNSEPSYRPTVLNNTYNQHVGGAIFNAAAFGPPPVGPDVFSNPNVAKRNLLWGPGTWGVNFGVHKDFHATERLTFQFGADVDNIFNHPLLSPDANDGGGGGTFALVGDFNIRVDPATGALLPVAASDIIPNPNFGRLIKSYTQEGIDSRRTIRLRARVTF